MQQQAIETSSMMLASFQALATGDHSFFLLSSPEVLSQHPFQALATRLTARM
jgi:hypothetical protein